MNLRQVAHALIGFCSRHGLDSPGPEMWDLSDRMARESSMSASGAGQRTRRARKKTFFLRPDVEADNPVASRREHALFADCEACDRVLGIAVGSQ